jgi:nicotinate phosphoribosyltransferase
MRPYSGLLTDLYELTMAAGYVQNRFEARATFELFVRELPPHRSYLVAAGLEQALEYLENVRFDPEDVAYLRHHPVFRHVGEEFFAYLEAFRFTGDVWALPEGTVFFPAEPLLRVTAPIAEAQILETYLLATLNYQSLVATKAARITTVAGPRHVIDFGTRRAHGIASGVLAARAAYIGGCAGTSNVYAGQRFGIPTYGTQAHSWIMAYEREEEAFRRFQEVFPEHSILLVDTYDVRAAVEKIIAAGRKPRGIRLDSGDIAADSRWARSRLDAAGWNDVQIFASGNLDEYRIAALLEAGAQVDGFGVGTALVTSEDAPSLGVVYKLVEVEEQNERRLAAKFSDAKTTYPGRKQVFRFSDARGEYYQDWIALEDEPPAGGEPLLVPVMRAGQRLAPAPPLAELRERCLASLRRLPAALRQLKPAGEYPVRYSPQLTALQEKVRQRIRQSDAAGRASSRPAR